MTLVEAIDCAVAYVRTHPQQMTRAEADEFLRLDEDVYILVVDAGLVNHLPKEAELLADVAMESSRPARLLGKLCLPGDWKSTYQGDGDPLPTCYSLVGEPVPDKPVYEYVFLTAVPPRWFRDMTILRRLAEAKNGATSPQKAQGRPDAKMKEMRSAAI